MIPPREKAIPPRPARGPSVDRSNSRSGDTTTPVAHTNPFIENGEAERAGNGETDDTMGTLKKTFAGIFGDM